MTDQEPPELEPLPQTPPGSLWISLILPPLLTVFTTIVLVRKSMWNNSSSNMNQDGTVLLALPLALVVVFCFLGQFLKSIRQRYRGRSVGLLGAGFVIGQIIICLVLWLATCGVVFNF